MEFRDAALSRCFLMCLPMQIRQDVRNRKIILASASLRGSRFLKTSSCAQAIVAQWSAEAELYAVVSGATEELGMVSLLSGVWLALGDPEKYGYGRSLAGACRKCAILT